MEHKKQSKNWTEYDRRRFFIMVGDNYVGVTNKHSVACTYIIVNALNYQQQHQN